MLRGFNEIPSGICISPDPYFSEGWWHQTNVNEKQIFAL